MKKFDLEDPLFTLETSRGHIRYTMMEAVNGFFIAGSVGSGKTTGSAKYIALNMLQKDLGGLVLCCKNSERDDWISYAKETGRENDLIILEPGGHHKFNVFDYLITNKGGMGLTENIVDVLTTVIEASSEVGKQQDEFWSQSLHMVLFFTVQLAKMAYGTLDPQLLYDLVQTLPKEGVRVSPEKDQAPSAFYKAYKIIRDKVKNDIDAWKLRLGPDKVAQIQQAGKEDEAIYKTYPYIREFRQLDDFFLNTFRNLAEKTKSIIMLNITGFLFRLLQEPVYSLLCTGVSTVRPEMCDRGKIVLVNLPTKEFHKIGKDAQVMIKLIFQRAFEARKIEDDTLPVFMYIDEFQSFLHSRDADFQATARSSRIISCLITQNISNLYATMGGDKPEAKVNSYLATLGTKIWHSQTDVPSNKYLSEIIGQEFQADYSESVSLSEKFSQSRNKSMKLQQIMRPESFTDLMTGGKLNAFLVEGIIHCQGSAKFHGRSFIKVMFSQLYTPTKNNKNPEPIKLLKS